MSEIETPVIAALKIRVDMKSVDTGTAAMRELMPDGRWIFSNEADYYDVLTWDSYWVYYHRTVTPDHNTAYTPPVKVFPSTWRVSSSSGESRAYIDGEYAGKTAWSMKSWLAGSSVRVQVSHAIRYVGTSETKRWSEYWSIGPRGVIETYGGPVPYLAMGPYSWHLE